MRLRLLPPRLDRYVFRQLLGALVAVTVGLTALIWLTQSLRFVELVVNRGLSLLVFLHLTSLLIPSFVAVILPITTYVVIQFVYQRLSGDREVTVMRAAGLSPVELARPALVLALIATLGGYWLNLSVVPATLASFKEFQWQIRNQVAAFLLQEGVFTAISEKLVVYVRSRAPDGSLRGILVDDARDPAVRSTILAESGQLLAGAHGPRVLLLNGSRQEIDRQTGRLNMLTFTENEIDLMDAAGPEGVRPPDMSEVPVGELLNPRFAMARDVPKWIAEGHKRLANPLASVSYALVALVSVLTGTFRRHGGIVRPLASVLCVVSLVAVGLIIDGLAARDNALIPLIWARTLLPAAIGATLLFGSSLRPRRRRRRTPVAAFKAPPRAPMSQTLASRTSTPRTPTPSQPPAPSQSPAPRAPKPSVGPSPASLGDPMGPDGARTPAGSTAPRAGTVRA